MTGRPRRVWKSAIIECEPGFEDPAVGLIFEAGFSGIEEHPGHTPTRFTAFFEQQPGADPLSLLAQSFACLAPPSLPPPASILSVETLPDTDWESKWREGLGAVESGRQLVVRPSWVSYDNKEGRIEIIIDPKMAFGTGGHATTRLCLEALESLNPSGKTVLDIGCGSGVLSIAAAKLGASRVFGFDNDPFSIENAIENIIQNGVADRVSAAVADLSDVQPEPSDIVPANVISGALIANLPRIRSFLAPGGIVVFSGLLAEEEGVFLDHLHTEGFTVRSVEHCEEWIAVIAEKSGECVSRLNSAP
jgi:ribosomal protein L11 methyltransferase